MGKEAASEAGQEGERVVHYMEQARLSQSPIPMSLAPKSLVPGLHDI